MLVKILGFGCNWWRRYGANPHDRFRYTAHAAFYNSTGVQCGRKIRRHWVIPGLIRFNGTTTHMQHDRNLYIGQTFICTEPVFALGGNRVVFEKKASDKWKTADYFLLVITADRFGAVQFQSPTWKSDATRVIAASWLREKQEAMLLMNMGEWIQTSLGRWYLTAVPSLQSGAALQLAEG
jgi:hypothetical protein